MTGGGGNPSGGAGRAAMRIGERTIGAGNPTYIVAEMSANHGQDLGRALEIVAAAKEAGADALKVQTYTPDTLTLDSDREHFRLTDTIWRGRTLHDLYGEAYMPWEWQPRIREAAEEIGLDFFSTPFDESAVEFLEGMNVPAYKVASFEIVDIPLLRAIARTGKPVILSTGMAFVAEIEEAIEAIRSAGGGELALMKCTSAYPASPAGMNLLTIPDLASRFGVPVGLSDHTLGSHVAVAAVALGACIVEKHFTLSRSVPGPDSSFSMEPREFAEMVRSIRVVEAARGAVSYGAGPDEAASGVFRRSLFVVEDVAAGEELTRRNVRSVRPGSGLHTRHLDEIVGRRAARAIERGTPLDWTMVERS